MSVRKTILACLASILAVSAVTPASAHRLAPSALSLEETAPGRFDVAWKTPRLVARGARVEPVLPEGCTPVGESAFETVETAWVQRFELECKAGLVGHRIGATGLEESGTDALLNLEFLDGRTLRFILTASSPSQEIPERESALQVFGDYSRLGVEHLISGLDHVLFVLGLLFLVGGGRRLIGAVTAFTLGHSITLALASFGWAPLPQSFVEIGIALSIVVLAVELVRPGERAPSVLSQRPWLMSFSFGLLHGLGFAGALAELGLPAHAIPLALFSFNVGIEVGQLGIILLALPVVWWLSRRETQRGFIGELPATAIGSLGAYWCIERSVAALLG